MTCGRQCRGMCCRSPWCHWTDLCTHTNLNTIKSACEGCEGIQNCFQDSWGMSQKTAPQCILIILLQSTDDGCKLLHHSTIHPQLCSMLLQQFAGA